MSTTNPERQPAPPSGRLLVALCALAALIAAEAGLGRSARGSEYLLDNFSEARHQSVAGPGRVFVDRTDPKVGLRCLTVGYNLSAGVGRAEAADRVDVNFDTRGREAGTVKFFVRGDGSGNVLRLTWCLFNVDQNGRPADVGRFAIDVKLDFAEWKAFSARPQEIPQGPRVRFVLLQVMKAADAKSAAGSVSIDEMTVDSPAAWYPGDVLLSTVERLEDPSSRVTLTLDVRNYSAAEPAACTLQAKLADARGNRVGEIRKRWEVPPGDAQEQEFAFDAKLQDFIPPLEIACEFISAGLKADLSMTRRIPMPTARELFEGFERVTDLWRGGAARIEDYVERPEQPVVTVDPGTVLERIASEQPFGPHAMRWSYTLADGRDDAFYAQFMPGAPVAMTVWVKGDGSGNDLVAGTRDWGQRIRGGNNQSAFFLRHVCRLDFTDWRQFTFDLPGAGLGGNDPVGTGGIDYPLELTGFSIRSTGKERSASGSICIGPIFLASQVESAKAVGVRIAAKADDGLYHAGDGATVYAWNYHLSRPRNVRVAWSLRGIDGGEAGQASEAGQAGAKEIAAGVREAALKPASFAAVPLSLPDIPRGAGPLVLKADLVDGDDPAAAASAEIYLGQPNAVVAWHFGVRREYHTNVRALFAADDKLLAEMPPKVLGPVVEPQANRAALPLNWARDAGQPRAISAVILDPALPGLPTRVTLDVFGDGSGVVLHPLFSDKGTEPKDTYLNCNVAVTDAIRVDFTGWRQVAFRAPLLHPYWNSETYRRHHMLYPVNMLLVAAADEKTAGSSGRLLIDNLRVETHLPPSERLQISLAAEDAAGFSAPGRPIRIRVENRSLVEARTLKLLARIVSPEGTEPARVERSLNLAPGGEAEVALAEQGLPRGAWWLEAECSDGANVLRRFQQALVVMSPGDLAPNATWPDSFRAAVVGTWPEFIISADRLKAAVGEFREYVTLDWDLLEPHPEDFQLDGLRARLAAIRKGGGTTRMLLGYSAHWAAGDGLQQRRTGSYNRPNRHIGYTTDIWHVPEDIADWDNFIYRAARDVGDLVDVWSFWDNPDVPGLLQLPAPKAVEMLRSVRGWTRRYSPNSRVLLAGLGVSTAVTFLKEFRDAAGDDDLYDAVNVKINPGIHPPEIWGMEEYVLGLRQGAPGKDILVTEMDWPVEPADGGTGFNALGQGCYVSRTALLAHWLGIQQPEMKLRNPDDFATGTGLTHRLGLGLSGTNIASDYLVPRPAYLALLTLRRWMTGVKPYVAVRMDDADPNNTRVLIYAAAQGSAAAVWRVHGSATIELPAGAAPRQALNAYGSAVDIPEGRRVPVSETPLLLAFPEQTPEGLRLAMLSAVLRPAQDEDAGKAMVLRDRVLPAFKPSADAHAYRMEGGSPARFEGILPGAGVVSMEGFTGASAESCELACPADADMVLIKGYVLEGKGQKAEVLVNGKSAGTWDLLHTRKELQGGPREAQFVVPKALLDPSGKQKVELRYGDTPGSTWSLAASSLRSASVPLGQLSPIYAAQAVGEMRLDRNVVGDELKVGAEAGSPRGIGSHAWSVIEYPLNGQYSSFTVLGGVDACSDGRGTVKFEILGDGRTLASNEAGAEKLAKTQTLTGLTKPQRLTADVTGVGRLTLVIHDADDGNRGDAADWLEPVLTRK